MSEITLPEQRARLDEFREHTKHGGETLRWIVKLASERLEQLEREERAGEAAEGFERFMNGRKPLFEERYGPWICSGCGLAHKLGDPCPTDVVTDGEAG